MITMSQFYETERLRVQPFREIMEEIGITMLGLDFGKFSTDGTIIYTNQAVCNFEFKNEMGCTAGDPNERNIAYYIKAKMEPCQCFWLV